MATAPTYLKCACTISQKMLILCIKLAMSATALVYPLDLIRMRVTGLLEPPSLQTAVKYIFKEHGFSGFYQGIRPTMMSAAVTQGVNFAVYDLMMDVNCITGIDTYLCKWSDFLGLSRPQSSL